MAITDRGNNALLNQNRIPALNARLHTGHDGNAEYRNQSNLLSSVQYNSYAPQGLGIAEALPAAGSLFAQSSTSPLNFSSTTQSFIGDNNSSFALQLNNSAAFPPNTGAGPINSDAQVANLGSNPAVLTPAPAVVLPPANTDVSLPRENFGLPASTGNSINIPNDNGGTNLTGGPVSTPPGLPAPVVITAPTTGNENQPIGVSITVTPQTDSGGTTIVVIGNVPNGATLSAGTNEGNGTWNLTLNQLPGLTLTPPAYAIGEIDLTVTAVSTENGQTSSTVATAPVIITGVAIAPTLSATPASGPENTTIALNIGSTLANVDPNEALSVTITGVPSGATLSAGTHNNDGSWTLTPAQLAGLTLTPPNNFIGTLNLNVTATTSENNTTASVSTALSVTVTGVASVPTLSVQAASGNEDTSIALNISTGLLGDVTHETLTVMITGVPPSAVLSAGTHNSDGSWTLTTAQLAGLMITPAQNYNGTINLNVTATASENGTSAHISSALPVTVNPIAETPTLSVQSSTGNENTAIALNISAALANIDPNETLSLTVSGVPSGATLSAGVNNHDGSWTLTAAQLLGLTLTPANNYTGTINLNVTATANENGTHASISLALPVTVNTLVDAPSLTVQAASGNQDTAIALHITSALTDVGTSETLSIIVGGIPSGATLSAGTNNGNGTWTLTSAQLSGLTFTPPLHASGSYTLSVWAVASENGVSANTEANLPVTVNSTSGTPATPPILVITNASGSENTSIPLTIVSSVIDIGETLSLTIGGVPSGAVLSAGTNNHDGTWTLSPAQLLGLTLTPATNYVGTLNLTVAATGTENGNSASTSGILSVDVTGSAAHAPTLVVLPAAGNENTAIALNITSAMTDISTSENLTLTISSVPSGATLSAGTNNHDGTWTLTPAQLSGLTITPASWYTGTLHLGVTATASDNGTSASASAGLNVTVNTVVNAPSLTLQAAAGNENAAIPISISTALADTGSPETLSVNITGVPAGAVLSAGTQNSDGSWTLSTAQLSGLTVTPPNYFIGTMHLVVASTASENGINASTSGNLNVTVAGVAETPVLTVQAASGNEDNPIALTIAAALPNIDPNENLSITIGSVPSGAVLSAGVNNHDGTWTLSPAQLLGLTITPPAHYVGTIGLTVTATTSENSTSAPVSANLAVTVNEIPHAPTITVQAGAGLENAAIPLAITAGLTDNSETLSVTLSGVPAGAVLNHGQNNGNGTWSLAPGDLVGLTITPPRDYNGTLALTATAISTDTLGNSASTTAALNVGVTAVADMPTLVVVPAVGSEDAPIALTINSALTNILGSETLSVHIAGVPVGATLSAGTNNGNGSWTLTAAQLAGLTITPPAHSNADFTLTVSATATDNSDNATATTASLSLPVTVIGIAHTPTVITHDVTGAAGAQIGLSVSGALSANAGSDETLSYIIHGMPSGFALSLGTNNGDNTWTISGADLANLANLKLITPPNYNGTLTLYATAVEHSGEGAIAVSSASTFHVNVGNYATGFAVNLGLDVNVGGIGVNAGVDLFSGSGGLGAGTMNVEENTPYTISNNAGLLSGVLGGLLSLLSNVTVSGVPTGASFNQGTDNHNGTWTFTPTQFQSLIFTPPANAVGTYTLTSTAHLLTAVNIGLGSTTLNVLGIASVPTLTASAGAATEEHAITLNVAGALTNTDGLETLSYLVSGMPSGFTLNHGTLNSNGTWSLHASDLTGLTVTPAAGYSGATSVTVSAVATETDGSSATVQQTLNLNIAPTAHAPAIAAVSFSGNEDTAISLNLGISAYTNEHISALTISGVPTGATLSYGTNLGGGVWSIDPNHIANVQLTPPMHWNGDTNLTVTATSQNGTSGPTVSTTETLPLHVAAVATAPSLTVADSTGNHDSAIALNINAAGLDTGGAENVSVVLSGVPNGGQFSAGTNNGNGTWTVAESALHNLTFTAPQHFSGDITLTATAWATEVSNGSVASTHADMHIHVLP